ncbi:MAG TPA: PD-(D/E)XK nuclease family protein, partial [Thermoanaerobaculia bacterium]|nr:PD-(D/E)XK nuclease family protein [Thermoanaerobaculia bacterium]
MVPSRSLRLHLASALVRRRGRAVAGVEIVTLFGVAARTLHLAGEPLPQGEALFGVLARRWARKVPALAEGLEDLVDGYGAVAATVRDFLDAGFEPGLAEGVAQAAAEAARADGRPVGTRAERERAAALAELAAAVERGMSALGVGRSTHLFRRAVELLAVDPDLLPTRAVLVHGFGDATAVASDLLAALLGRPGSVLILDRPPRPVDPADPFPQVALEASFTERLFARLAGVVEAVEGPGPGPEPARLRSFSAPGAAAEARELARRIRALLDREDEPVAPEEIGVVLRELRPDQPYATALRRAFERSGIPFSGVGGAGPLLPAGRRLLALSELLRRRDATPTGRWLDALEAPPGLQAAGAQRHRLFELRLAFHTLGAGRLGEVAALAPERFGQESFPLPIRQGLAAIDGEAGGREGAAELPTAGVARRRRVPSESLRQAAEAARRLVERLRSWPREAPLAEHLHRLRELLAEDLGWRRSPTGRHDQAADPGSALDGLEREVPGALELSFEELFLLLERTWERSPRGAGRDALGGRGGGVAVLGALEARGRTFRHLFVAGLNRGSFPRTVQEDPLLPDDLRRALHPVLPDLPLKLAGFDEERYLFAQLLAAAPEVTLSWRAATEEGQPLPVSPLVERLALIRNELRDDLGDGPGVAPGGAEGARDTEPAEPRPTELRPPLEHATEAGLAGDRDAFAALLAVALGESRPDLEARGARALATAHRAVLDEMDPDLSTAAGQAARASLGPYFGFLGPPAPGDPRLGPLSVTALEGLSACPWQTFLRRLLRLEPTPDPLEALPALDPLLLGSLVHAVLEEVVDRVVGQALPVGGPVTLAEVLAAAGERGLGDVLGSPLDGGPADGTALAESTEPAGRRRSVGVPWPEPEVLEAILRRQARRLLEEKGVVLPGLARALVAAARPFLEAARAADWAQGPVPALGAELEGSLEVADPAGRPRTLSFRADRVDAVPGRRNATFRLTDYKTGKPFSTAKKEATRRQHFLGQVAAGRRLQAVAYAIAAGARTPGQPDAVGRYLFLRQGVEPEHRELAAWSSGVDFVEAFATAVRTALAAWDGGAFFPRLVEPDKDEEPALCGYCEVREACLRGDSGARRRLAAWAEAR